MAYLGTEPGVSSQRLKQTFTATAAQTDFPVAGGYYIGQVDVMYNGSFLDETEFTATDGLKVVLAAPATAGHKIVVISYLARGLSDGYLKGEADARFVSATNGSVGTNNLASASVTTDKIADTNVTTAKLADGSVTAVKHADGSVTTTKIADQNVTLAKLARVGTAGQVLTSGGAGADPAYTTLNVVVPVDVQTFNSTGTWTKPSGGQTMARIQAWGGGGGGGVFGGYGQGGCGGGYTEWTGPLANISSQTVVIGAGGAGTATNHAAAGTGGTTSFSVGGKTVTATGGKGGLAENTIGTPGPAGTPQGAGSLIGSLWMGGIGGNRNSDPCTPTIAPTISVYGGGGGGAASDAGGVSAYGGNGGTNSVGVIPAGGGGGSSAGASGRIVITCW